MPLEGNGASVGGYFPANLCESSHNLHVFLFYPALICEPSSYGLLLYHFHFSNLYARYFYFFVTYESVSS